MSMRGIYTSVNDIRKRVFAEVARLSYDYKEGDLSEMELIPYRIIPGEVSTYRESVFLERAIVKVQQRLLDPFAAERKLRVSHESGEDHRGISQKADRGKRQHVAGVVITPAPPQITSLQNIEVTLHT